MNSIWGKTHWLIKTIFSKYVWDIPNKENKVYLTFDDGPIPEVTDWVLSELKTYNAKATFFCIGANINKNPEIFNRVISQGHSIGNHTFNHLKGWKTETNAYLENVASCQTEILKLKSDGSPLFRPPYGKVKPKQSKILRRNGYKIIMWDIISYDFDATVSKEKCLQNVLKNVESGSIIVFHDSKKAFTNLQYALPKTLAFLKEKGFVCDRIV